jgi:hypothetical protein
MKSTILLFFLFSCTFSEENASTLNTDVHNANDLEENRNQVATDMANLNSRMRARLIRDERYQDFASFTSNEYLKSTQKYQIPSDREYMSYLSSGDLQIVMAGKGKVFIVCSKSIKQRLVFCDRSDTAMPEYSNTDTGIDLNKKIQEFM